MAGSNTSSQRKLWGTVTRRDRWGLSWRGWIAAAVFLGLAGGLFVARIVPFLAVTRRVDAHVLVVEGWVHDYAIRMAVEEFKQGAYQRVLTTGGPVRGTGRYTNDFNTSASVAAERLVAAGLPARLVQMVPSRVTDRDRTYSSAVALRDWLHRNKVAVPGFNIVTEDIHARRTRLLFQKALGDKVAVGIIAVPDSDYDPERWWAYSEGVEDVLGQSLAYLYAKFVFIPSSPGPDEGYSHGG